jgi:hypothetical protein
MFTNTVNVYGENLHPIWFVPDPFQIYSFSSNKASILKTLSCQTGEQTQSVSDRGIYSADVESHQLLLYWGGTPGKNRFIIGRHLLRILPNPNQIIEDGTTFSTDQSCGSVLIIYVSGTSINRIFFGYLTFNLQKNYRVHIWLNDWTTFK